MDKKDIKLLEKLFNDSNFKGVADVLTHFHKRNSALKEILARQVVPDHLHGLSSSEAFFRILIPSDIFPILNLGIYHSFVSEDMSLLNDALYSYNRIAYNRLRLISSGTDHCKYLPSVIECFAGNDISLVKSMFPESHGLTQNGYRFSVVASNLVIAMLYNRKDWLQQSTSDAQKYVKQKVSNFDRAVVDYLICLGNGNGQDAGEYLSEVCHLYKRAKWVHDFRSPFLMVCGIFLHGLYNLAFHIDSRTVTEGLREPIHTAFWDSFTKFQKERSFSRGEEFLIFEDQLKALNCIYE
nr:hypothetical protein [uncultured Dyadobacter sp.]